MKSLRTRVVALVKGPTTELGRHSLVLIDREIASKLRSVVLKSIRRF